MIPLIPRLIIAAVLASGCGLVSRADELPPPDVLYQNAPKGLPSEPAWGYWPAAPESWIIVHKQFVERSKQGGVDIVFIGDSITKGWKQASASDWAGPGAALQAVNYGIGGDTTRQVLWRIDHGMLDGISPRLVVLMIGTNNLYSDHNAGTNEEIVDGVKAVLLRVRAKAPAARVLLLGVLPRQTKSWCDRIVALNGLLAGLGSPGRVEFHDAGAGFVGENGRLNPELYAKDLVHLNAAGYEVLNTAVKPLVRDLLARPPLAAASK